MSFDDRRINIEKRVKWMWIQNQIKIRNALDFSVKSVVLKGVALFMFIS